MNTFGKIGREHELTLYLNQTQLPGWRNVLLSVKSNSNARLGKLPLTHLSQAGLPSPSRNSNPIQNIFIKTFTSSPLQSIINANEVFLTLI